MKKELIEAIKTWVTAHKEISLFVVAASISLTVGIIKSSATSPEEPVASERVESFDTLIPPGHSLVPIEVANYETLDSLLGPFGVVDLFAAPPGAPESQKCIAAKVKIVRAPRNPSHFAVLVPMDQVQKILKYPGPFFVSVQNPKAVGTAFEKAPHRRRSRIVYN